MPSKYSVSGLGVLTRRGPGSAGENQVDEAGLSQLYKYTVMREVSTRVRLNMTVLVQYWH